MSPSAGRRRGAPLPPSVPPPPVQALVDTHVLLWWLDDSPKLGARARAQIADPLSAIWMSAATAWEIAIKVGLGRLDLSEPPEICLPRELERGQFRTLPVTVAHALAVRRLPAHHSDPFDRLLVAQARLEGLSIITVDPVLARYGVMTIDAAV